MRNAEGVLFAFSTPYHAGKKEDMHAHQARHGDGVKDGVRGVIYESLGCEEGGDGLVV